MAIDEINPSPVVIRLAWTPSCCRGPWAAMLPQAIDVLAAWGTKHLLQIVRRKERHRLPVRTCQEPMLPASVGGRQNHYAFPWIFGGPRAA
jgi:hypothetical protein